MTILATSGVALFSWFSASYEGLIRLEEIHEKQQLMDDLDAYFSTLNVRGEQRQEIKVNGFDVIWESTLADSMQQGRNGSGGLSNFDLGLYDVNVSIVKNDREIGDYEMRLVGYQKVRNVNDDDQ